MIVILHNIRSLYNVGSVFRTADAAGVEKIYLTGITPKPIDRLGKHRPQLTKVSLGAEKTVPWEYARSTSLLIKKLRREKYKIFAVEQSKKSVSYFRIKNHELRIKNGGMRIVIILGNEINGLPSSILAQADKILEIPMVGAKESLNVAVAFGVVAFHLKYSSK